MTDTMHTPAAEIPPALVDVPSHTFHGVRLWEFGGEHEPETLLAVGHVPAAAMLNATARYMGRRPPEPDGRGTQ